MSRLLVTATTDDAMPLSKMMLKSGTLSVDSTPEIREKLSYRIRAVVKIVLQP